MISGYFIYSSDRLKAISRCKRSLRKIILITLAANFFYLTVEAVLLSIGKQPPPPQLNFKSVLYFILIGDNINPHLWYLTAYIQVLLILMAILFLRIERLIQMIIPLGLLLALLSGMYSFLLPELPYQSIFPLIRRCSFSIGFPFFGIGYLIRKHEPQIMQGPIRLLGHPVVCLSLLALSIAEKAIISSCSVLSRGDIIFFTIPLTCSIFLFCLRKPDLGHGSFVETIGRKYATDIYIFQMFAGIVFTIVSIRVSALFPLPEILSPVFIFLLALLGSMLFKRLLSRLRLSLSPSE